jgi:hypothetical protein
MKFSIRDILALTMVVGVFFAWVCDHGRLEARYNREVTELMEQRDQSLLREAALRKQPATTLSMNIPIFLCGTASMSRRQEETKNAVRDGFEVVGRFISYPPNQAGE